MFRARHLQEDRLFECYLAEQGGEPIEPPAAEHLTDCAECGARYADLRRFMDALRTEANAELDEIFPPERMRTQQQQIARRVEHLGQQARVISFPGLPSGQPTASAQRTVLRVAPRWLGAAAAAGLLVGVGAGSFFYSNQRVPGSGRLAAARGVTAVASPIVPTSGTPNAGQVITDVNDQFLSELELALERPHTRELIALDDITPHVREVGVQLR